MSLKAICLRPKSRSPFEITLDALPTMRFKGHVSGIVPTVDRAKATVMTKIRFDQLDSHILPEMSAKVSFLSQEVSADDQKTVLAVDASAVATKDGVSVVYVIKSLDGKDTVEAVPVKVAASWVTCVKWQGSCNRVTRSWPSPFASQRWRARDNATAS